MKKQQVPLAREGYPFILFCAFIAFICAVVGFIPGTVTGLVLTTFVTWFFRDPSRVVPDDPQAIVCPADGRVILIKKVDENPFVDGKALKISIFMNVFNVHVNRIPYAGRVKQISFKPGKFYSADKDKAALHNEHCAITMLTPSGICYSVVQVAGFIARRIVCRVEIGDNLTAGERYGLIRFGSRVDLYLPPDTKVAVQLRQKVKAGETILANLKSEE